MSRERVVLPETREALLKAYTPAFEEPAYLRMLEYLLFSTRFDKDRPDYLIIDAATLARIEGKSHLLKHRNYSGKAFLGKFLINVQILLTEFPSYTRRKARIIQPSWSEAVREALSHELRATASEREERGVLLSTGKRPGKPTRKDAARLKAERQAQVEMLSADVPPDHPARDLLSFLNTQPSRAMTELVRRNLDAARDAGRCVQRTMTPGSQHYNLQLLHDIEHDPVPLYKTVERTPRLFPAQPSYLTLSREVRKTLLRGCTEFDLKNAQLALAAHSWDVPELDAFIRATVLRGGHMTIWRALAELAGLKGEQGASKPLFKRVVYGLLFGQGEGNTLLLLKEGNAELRGIGAARAEQFMASPLIRALLDARTAAHGAD